MSKREGRGGHWNRAGRRGGGYKPAPVYAHKVGLRCEVEGCAATATYRIPVSDGPDGALCADHAKRFMELIDNDPDPRITGA